MHRKVSSATVARPLAEVFDWVTTPGYWPQVSPIVLGVDASEAWRPVQTGERFRERLHIARWKGHVDWEVDVVERPHRIVIRGVSSGDTLLSRLGGHDEARIEYTFAGDERSTVVTREVTFPVQSLVSHLGGVLGIEETFSHACDRTVATMASMLENPLLRGPQPDAASEALLHDADPLADEAVASLIPPSGDCAALETFLAALYRGDPPSAGLPQPMREFLDATSVRASWACEPRLKTASDVFLDWGVLAVGAHICASLPETYVMPRTAKLLDLTRQLDADPTHIDRRLWFTVRMCFDVLAEHGLDSGKGKGLLALQRLRLLHAMVRLFVQHRLETPHRLAQLASAQLWDSQNGLPISQLELLHTLLTFSHVVIRSFDIFGCDLTPYQRESYIHLWNVAGAQLGIRPELLPRNAADASAMFEKIKARFGGATPEAARLGRALIVFWTSLFPEIARKEGTELMQFVISELLTPETVKINGLDSLPAFSPRAAKAIKHCLATTDRVCADLFADGPIVREATALVIAMLIGKASASSEKQSGIFDIPDELYERWMKV